MRMRRRLSGSLSLLIAAATLAGATQAEAATAAAQQTLVDKATLAVQDMFAGATPTSRIQRYLTRARAVLVCPSIFQMSIGIGGSGGGCVLLSRDARGSWSDPAFYRIGSGSIGIQLGMQDEEAMFFVMSDRGFQALLDSQFKMGADAAASFATMGTGIESGTTGETNTDIMAVQKSKGLYAGAALNGSKLSVNSPANHAYYGQPVGPEDIVVTMRVNNPGADPLRSILMRLSAQGGTSPATQAGPVSTTPENTGADTIPYQQGGYQTGQSTAPGAVQSQSLPAISNGH